MDGEDVDLIERAVVLDDGRPNKAGLGHSQWSCSATISATSDVEYLTCGRPERRIGK
jgi:hypothetical protein